MLRSLIFLLTSLGEFWPNYGTEIVMYSRNNYYWHKKYILQKKFFLISVIYFKIKVFFILSQLHNGINEHGNEVTIFIIVFTLHLKLLHKWKIIANVGMYGISN